MTLATRPEIEQRLLKLNARLILVEEKSPSLARFHLAWMHKRGGVAYGIVQDPYWARYGPHVQAIIREGGNNWFHSNQVAGELVRQEWWPYLVQAAVDGTVENIGDPFDPTELAVIRD